MRFAAIDRGQARPGSIRHLRPAWLILPLLLLLIPLVLFAFLQPFARSQTRKLLGSIDGLDADFSDVHVSLLPLSYRITDLKIRERSSKTKDPAFYAEEVVIRPRWGGLLARRLVGTIEGRHVKVVLQQPAEGSSTRLPTVEKLLPIRVEVQQVRITGSEVLYVWVRKPNRPSVWFHGIEATLENVASRPDLQKGRMVLSARGKVQRSGSIAVSVTASPYEAPLNFSGTSTVSGFDPSEMNSLVSQDQGVKLSSGQFAMETSFECRSGRLRGWLDPRLTGTEIVSAKDDVISGIKALLGRVSMTFASPADGTLPSGRIVFTDDLTDKKLQLWPTLEKVVENSFLLGLQEAIKRKTGPEKRLDSASSKPSEFKIK